MPLHPGKRGWPPAACIGAGRAWSRADGTLIGNFLLRYAGGIPEIYLAGRRA